MDIKALIEYVNSCKTKGTVPTVEGLKQFHAQNRHKYIA
jgi:hypothetical protein